MIAINKDRIVNRFCRLVAIDSLSFQEREMADAIIELFEEMGMDCQEDQAAVAIGGNAGNLLIKIPGKGEPVLLSAHMDTVSPGKGKKAIIKEDGKIYSDGSTVLGSDDVAGIVEIMEGVQAVLEAGLPHRPVEILLPVAEEVYTRGSDVFDYSQIEAREAYVLDMSGKIGTAALAAPTLISFTVKVQGKASHAGFHPEEGVNAIQVAARAITEIPQGNIDDITTLNIGVIEGGTATNIVSDTCVMKGEIRSFRHKRALQIIEDIREIVDRHCQLVGASFDLEYNIHLHAYSTLNNAAAVKHFLQACKKLQIKGKLVRTLGGSDNNSFARRGIPGIVLSNGMQEVHTVNECIDQQDLIMGAKLISELIRL